VLEESLSQNSVLGHCLLMLVLEHPKVRHTYGKGCSECLNSKLKEISSSSPGRGGCWKPEVCTIGPPGSELLMEPLAWPSEAGGSLGIRLGSATHWSEFLAKWESCFIKCKASVNPSVVGWPGRSRQPGSAKPDAQVWQPLSAAKPSYWGQEAV